MKSQITLPGRCRCRIEAGGLPFQRTDNTQIRTQPDVRVTKPTHFRVTDSPGAYALDVEPVVGIAHAVLFRKSPSELAQGLAATAGYFQGVKVAGGKLAGCGKQSFRSERLAVFLNKLGNQVARRC